jgi:hypothetical protein
MFVLFTEMFCAMDFAKYSDICVFEWLNLVEWLLHWWKSNGHATMLGTRDNETNTGGHKGVRVNQRLIFPQCPTSALCFSRRASWRGAEICRRWAENGHVNLPLPIIRYFIILVLWIWQSYINGLIPLKWHLNLRKQPKHLTQFI